MIFDFTAQSDQKNTNFNNKYKFHLHILYHKSLQ
jgi:hypothetical protein